jgi:feruloyl esterase
MRLDHAIIDAAESVAAGAHRPMPEVKDGPAFCHGNAEPVPGSRIGFELRLPETGWNGKLEMFGNGGYSSKISYDRSSRRSWLWQGFTASLSAAHTSRVARPVATRR